MSKIDHKIPVQNWVEDELKAKLQFGEKLLILDTKDLLAELRHIVQGARINDSQLMLADINATTVQQREILAEELKKLVANLPGSQQLQLSTPPTADELKKLIFFLADAELKGQREAARTEALIGNDSSPTGRAWSEFVQATTNAQAPKTAEGLLKDGASPGELLSSEKQAHGEPMPLTGAGLRAPIDGSDASFAGLSNRQKLDLMSGAFGADAALLLKDLGLRDPATLLKATGSADSRAELAAKLGISRGELTVHLSRAELLAIGAGRRGEQALRPQHLPALQSANIVTLSHLGALKQLTPGQFEAVFQSIRRNFSGFARAMSGERPILKKDLQHWSRAASRRKSSLLDADWEDLPQRGGDAEEVIMAWYLQHWAELEEKRAKQEEAALEREIEKLRRGKLDLSTPQHRADGPRDDGLICFWIERPNLNFDRPALTEMVYVCLDPKTGIVDLKAKE